MLHETITLSEDRNVTLTTYLIEDQLEYQHSITRPIIVICPGGGYSFLSEREAEPVALKYVAAGFHAAVLRYGINEHAVAPGPLKDLAGAVSYIRKHSDEWMVDRDSVIIMGFSAGAHVAGQLGVFWNREELLPEYKEDFSEIRPNGMILCYPVLDLHASCSFLDIGIKPGEKPEDIPFGQKHPKMPLSKMFIMNEAEERYFIDFEAAMNAYIFDGEYTAEQEDFYSLQNQVTKDTCPTFLWHCDGDGLIYPTNSLDFTSALKKHNVSAELHLYAEGGHGISLADYRTAGDRWQNYPYAASWITHSVDWVNRLTGFAEKIIGNLM